MYTTITTYCHKLLVACLLLSATFTYGQKKSQSVKTTASYIQDSSAFRGLSYRFAGPERGGRVTTVTGHPEKLHTFYMGATGGGVWKTEDAGTSWQNISDGQIPAGSIGAVSLAPSNHHIMYVGTGSACLRGNVSPGIGMYKSTNGGENWSFAGLPNAGQIAKVIIHPDDPEHVYAAVLGNAFAPNPERGVYESKDGGQNWEKVLYVSDSTGAADLVMHPENPLILFSAMWRAERKPHTMIDGGYEGGIYQSNDGGKNWKKVNKGLPQGLIGKIGLAISPANPQRIWAVIITAEEKDRGLYRSDDGGTSWQMVSNDNRLTQRGWYYAHVTADPNDENTVYINNVDLLRSVDGGKNFDEELKTPHGDHHDLWVHPKDSKIMINGNDGGATVSLNGGKTWSTQLNQGTPEFYRVTVDNQFPYRMYAGQQDNSTVSVSSHSLPNSSPIEWFPVGGSECADIAVDPRNPNIIYATSYSGEITYLNRENGQVRQITAYPHYTEGTKLSDLKYRWQWNYPVLVSEHNPDELYMASNYVHRSTDRGQSWEIISPDLTAKKAESMDIPGGPIQHDGTGVEVYSTIFALEESPQEAGVFWAGSDDGLVHISRDGGKSWQNITPASMPEEGTVNKIELSMHAPGRALMAVQRYRLGDFQPYIYLTNDYGQSWQLLTSGSNGIPADHFVRAIAEDPDRQGLLYAGTEFGMYVSFDEGKNWLPFQLNLPHTPITDMEVHQQELVISTQGRGFWIMDDLTPLHQLDAELVKKPGLLEPATQYRTNLDYGLPVRLFIYMPEDAPEGQEARLEILDNQQSIAAVFGLNPDKEKGEKMLQLKQGFNQLDWNMRYPGPMVVEDFVAMVFSHPAPGYKAVPGTYTARFTYGNAVQEQSFTIAPDPRWDDISQADYQAQFDLAREMSQLITTSQKQLKNIRSVREQLQQIKTLTAETNYAAEVEAKIQPIDQKLEGVAQALFQEKIKTTQDEINYARKFTNHIARLYRVVIEDDHRPTGGMLERWEDLQADYQGIIAPLEEVMQQDIPAFNQWLKEQKAEGIIVPYRAE